MVFGSSPCYKLFSSCDEVLPDMCRTCYQAIAGALSHTQLASLRVFTMQVVCGTSSKYNTGDLSYERKRPMSQSKSGRSLTYATAIAGCAVKDLNKFALIGCTDFLRNAVPFRLDSFCSKTRRIPSLPKTFAFGKCSGDLFRLGGAE